MKLARFTACGITSYGVVNGNTVKAIRGLPWEALSATGAEYALSGVELLAPVEPPNVIAIGANYRKHIEESGAKVPSAPLVFLKATTAVTGPGKAVVLPAMAPGEVDFEAELAIVIGRTCRRVSEADALGYVLGYTCANDISARDCQRRLDSQWARAKSFDTFCPLGPWIETELDGNRCGISLKLNGQTLQHSNTADMLFSCRKLISYCSQFATLLPGTVILTGTPEGVGFARKPPLFLKAGDVMEVGIEGIGVLENPVTLEQETASANSRKQGTDR